MGCSITANYYINIIKNKGLIYKYLEREKDRLLRNL